MGHLGNRHVKHVTGWLSSQLACSEGCVKPAAPCLAVASPSRNMVWMWRIGRVPGHQDPRSIWLPQSAGLKRSACHGWGRSLLLNLMHLEERGLWLAPWCWGVLLWVTCLLGGCGQDQTPWCYCPESCVGFGGKHSEDSTLQMKIPKDKWSYMELIQRKIVSDEMQKMINWAYFLDKGQEKKLNFSIKNLQCVVDEECFMVGGIKCKKVLLSGWMLTLCVCVCARARVHTHATAQ